MKIRIAIDTRINPICHSSVVLNEDEEENFGEYIAIKKRAREAKRINDEQHRKKEERSKFNFEDFYMDYFE